MRELNVLLTNAEPETERILLEEVENYILLVLSRKPSLQSVLYTFSNEAGYSVTVPTSCETFLRPKKKNYTHVQFQGNFLKNNYVKIAVYLGTWVEILLIDLSLNLEFLYQNAELDILAFRIGLPNMSNLLVKITSDKSYDITRTLISSPTAIQTTHAVVLNTDMAAKDIENIYLKIKDNLTTKGFTNNQLAKIDELRKNTSDFLINY